MSRVNLSGYVRHVTTVYLVKCSPLRVV